MIDYEKPRYTWWRIRWYRILERLLPNELPDDVSITLIDRVPYHCLKTKYYALAAGTISEQDVRVAFPEDPKLKIIYAEVEKIDLEEKKVVLANEEDVSYDDLIIGLGCDDKFNHVPGAEEFSYSIQTFEKARNTYQALNNLQAWLGCIDCWRWAKWCRTRIRIN